MMIFDSFPNEQLALAFAVQVRDKFGQATRFCKSQTESDKYDPFPYRLDGPIVLVALDQAEGPHLETEIESFVDSFDGLFAGT
jgi:hypothetical protein